MQINEQNIERLNCYYRRISELLTAYLDHCGQPEPMMEVEGFSRPMTASQFFDVFESMSRKLYRANPKIGRVLDASTRDYSRDSLERDLDRQARDESLTSSALRLRLDDKALALINDIKQCRSAEDDLFAGIFYQDRIRDPEVKSQLVPFVTNANRHLISDKDVAEKARVASQEQEKRFGEGFYSPFRIVQGDPLLRQCANAIAMVTGDDSLINDFSESSSERLLKGTINGQLARMNRSLRQVGQNGPTP